MITTEKKAEIIKEYQLKEGDTGSPEVQIAILTYRINDLNGSQEGPSLKKRPFKDGRTEKKSS